MNPTPLKDNFTYNWRVRGYSENLNRYGEWSSVWKFTTQVEPVGTITLLSPENNSTVDELTPTLTWNTEPKSQSYTVQVSTDEFSTFVVDEVVTDTTVTTPTLSYCTEYQWRVRGINEGGKGQWSEIWSFTTDYRTFADHEELTTSYELNQNYPNPFNPSTQIRFAIPEPAHVNLSVYNLLGQQVATIVNETRSAGWYDETFDASRLSSGVFIYRIEAGEFVEMRQMMFVK